HDASQRGHSRSARDGGLGGGDARDGAAAMFVGVHWSTHLRSACVIASTAWRSFSARRCRACTSTKPGLGTLARQVMQLDGLLGIGGRGCAGPLVYGRGIPRRVGLGSLWRYLRQEVTLAALVGAGLGAAYPVPAAVPVAAVGIEVEIGPVLVVWGKDAAHQVAAELHGVAERAVVRGRGPAY